ncbi:MAG: hypothetical protein EA383_16040 [Spirochaetaceae bacterium]|nr:MAG: hypothetical protein EA383_16040 [Spirochaetaceae bacterium]
MNRHADFSFRNLDPIFASAPIRSLTPESRIIIFSDLHMGNGGKNDDFRQNAEVFSSVLEHWYLPRQHHLILNGDVEELLRFSLHSIQRQWHEVFSIFDRYRAEVGMDRIIGNHDYPLADVTDLPFPLHDGLRYRIDDEDVFIFHGHQVHPRYVSPKKQRWINFFLRYFANPLGIGNVTVSHDSRKRFKTERRVYHYASVRKVLSVIGHTHRPLFESLSKADTIKFQIELMCRRYTESDGPVRERLAGQISSLKSELETLRGDPHFEESDESLYNANLVVPCMFNSGGVIGERGITGIEIEGRTIRLVYWFDSTRSQTYLRYRRFHAEQLNGTSFYRVVIKEDSLDYIFARIRLLS